MKSDNDKNQDLIKKATIGFLANNMTSEKLQELYDAMTPNGKSTFLVKMIERVLPKPEKKNNSGLSQMDMMEFIFNQMLDNESKSHRLGKNG